MGRRFSSAMRNAILGENFDRHGQIVCEECGSPLGEDWHADHVIPWSRGGPTTTDNGRALCPACNLRKGAKMPPTAVAPPATGFEPRKWQRELVKVTEVRRLLDQPLAEPGGDRSGGGEEQDNNVILPSRQGNDPGYTRRRLRRDRPDLYERVVEGELSANAAAIEAGFRRRTATIPVDSVESAVGALLRRFTAAEIVAAAKAKAGVDG